jgi:hypothetical protein
MFKTYDVFESVWQANPFVTLEAGRDGADLDDLASELSAMAEPADETEMTEDSAPAPVKGKYAA